MNTIDILKQHRSIRKYKDQAIDKKVLLEIIDAGRWASTSSFVQAYSLIRLNDKEKRLKLYEWTGGQKNVLNAPEFLIFCADLTLIEKACIKHDVNLEKEYTEWLLIASVDTALFAQNIMVAAESLGLGGVYVGAIRNEIDKVSSLLKLPQGVVPLFGMCLGYPDQEPNQKPRLPLDLILHEEVYQSPDEELLNQYDEEIKAYYIERTKGRLEHSWTEQMAQKASGENRPHIKSFLESKGYNKR